MKGPAAVPSSGSEAVFFGALFTALLFVVHPLQTQAVTYIVQRYTSLAAFFYFGSILCYVQARQIQTTGAVSAPGAAGADSGEGRGGRKNRPRAQVSRPPGKDRPATVEKISRLSGKGAVAGWYLLFLAAAALAFLSKQNTASLPLAVLLVEFFLFDRTGAGWRRKILWIAAGLGFWVLLVSVAAGLFSKGPSLGDLLNDLAAATKETEVVGRWDYLVNQFNVLVIYVRLLFLPVFQNLDHLYRFRLGFFSGTTPLAFLFLVSLLALALGTLRKRPALSFGILWFFITLSVESSVIPIKDALVEHRLYLAVFGYALALCASLFGLVRLRRSWVAVFLACLVVAYGSATLARNHVWRNAESLWQDVLSKSPHNVRAMIHLGNLAMDGGRYGEAREYYSMILERWPDSWEGRYYLALVAREEGNLEEAKSRFSLLLKETPADPGVIAGLAAAYRKQGNVDKALDVYREGLKANPRNAEIPVLLGKLLRESGRVDEAASQLSETVRKFPGHLGAREALGGLLLEARRFGEAEREFRRLIERDPRRGRAWEGLGESLARQGRFDEAEEPLVAAVEASPGDGKPLLLLAMTRANARKYREALESYREALSASPGSAVFIAYQMARLHALLGEGPAALEWLGRSVEEGLEDPALPAGDPAWEPFREREGYRSLLERMGRKPGE